MTSTPSSLATPVPALAAVYRHVGDAHQRLAHAVAALDADVAAACLEDLYAALELLEGIEPSLGTKRGDPPARAAPEAVPGSLPR